MRDRGPETAPELMAEAVLALDAVARPARVGGSRETHVTFGGVAVARGGQRRAGANTRAAILAADAVLVAGRRGAGRSQRSCASSTWRAPGHGACAFGPRDDIAFVSPFRAPAPSQWTIEAAFPDRRIAHDAHRCGRRRSLERSRRRSRSAIMSTCASSMCRPKVAIPPGRIQREPVRRRPRCPRVGRADGRDRRRAGGRPGRGRTGCSRSTGRASSCRHPTAATRWAGSGLRQSEQHAARRGDDARARAQRFRPRAPRSQARSRRCSSTARRRRTCCAAASARRRASSRSQVVSGFQLSQPWAGAA